MAQAATKLEPNDPVREAAQVALTKSDGDVQAAADLLEANVRKSRDLRDALTEPLITNACYDAVRAVCIKERRAIWQPPREVRVKSLVAGASRVKKLAAGNLLMFPLPGGKRLTDANRAEITKAVHFYDSQSRDMGQKARWLQLVAQHLEDDKTVGEVLTDERLRELQTEANHD